MQSSEILEFEQNSINSENLHILIDSVEEVSGECVKIIPSKGPSFFIRLSYLTSISPELICAGQSFCDEKLDELLLAGYAFLAEREALNYLNRCEHSRFLLSQKLQKKGHSLEAIELAFDYLEGKNYLSDRRFAISWLRNRRITKSEGRTKLFQHLLSRGISKSIAEEALDEFYEEFSEFTMLEKAYSKCLRQNLSQEKLEKKMISWGFSYSMVRDYQKKCLEE
jgi:regulatory protein